MQHSSLPHAAAYCSAKLKLDLPLNDWFRISISHEQIILWPSIAASSKQVCPEFDYVCNEAPRLYRHLVVERYPF